MLTNLLNSSACGESTEYFKAKCPFCGQTIIHTENYFSCYFCNKSGTASDLLALKNKISKSVADQMLDNYQVSPQVYARLQSVLEIFESNLKPEHPYLKKRGLTKEIIDKYHIGWSDGTLAERVSDQGKEELLELGLIKKDGFEIFRNRLIFPIFDEKNRVIGFGGRIIKDAVRRDGTKIPKYVNSPESDIFKKKNILYGIQNINPKEPVYLLEGYLDVITAQAAGVNAVACLGVAFGLGHIELLKSLNVKQLIIALDSDEVGQKNAVKAAALAKDYFDTQVLKPLVDAKDADEYISKYGGDSFKKAKIVSAKYFLMQQNLSPVDIL